MQTRTRAGRRTLVVRGGPLALAVASVLIAACSTTGNVGGSAVDDPAAEDGTRPSEHQDPEDSAGSLSNSLTDMCEVVSPDDIVPVLEAAAGTELIIGHPTPLVAGECSFDVERPGTGGSHVQIRVGDESAFGHHRNNEDVTDRPGLGDEAYTFYGVAGPELHVRQGGTWLGVRFGSYDDRFGFTEDSHGDLAAIVLDLLSSR